ncbi:MAG: FtsX-like permease family protein [Planctomycetes bacterium]|nr:FtsX-like permease family protein [Planctomycetota bacterium]
MFLYCVVEATQAGVTRATAVVAGDSVLVVYRENRYCPFTSRLPQHYQPRIAQIPGVAHVVPMKILVSNCRASLDVVTFRGVPEQDFLETTLPDFEIVAGSAEAWSHRSDAALVGDALASRRGIKVGDRFSAAGITVYVAAIGRTDELQSRNAAYTHLAFLQEAAQRGGTGGVVTQFNVTVSDPERLDAIAQAIDAEFAADSEPTFTQPEKAFVGRAATDVVEIVGFARWLGWGALAAVFALVANAIVLAINERVREYAILETLGFTGATIAGLIVAEGALLGLLGGGAGAVGAFALLSLQTYSVSMEGVHVEVSAGPSLLLSGLVASIVLSVLAGAVPALRVARGDLAGAFRT